MEQRGLAYRIMEKLGYTIGYGFAQIRKFKIASFISLAFLGVGFIGCLVLLSFNVTHFIAGLVYLIVISLVVLFIVGLITLVVHLPFNMKRNKYIDLFKDIKLVAMNDEIPLLIEENENDNLIEHVFKSYIPIEEWIKKKNLLETFLNKSIVKIYNAEGHKDIVIIWYAKQPLPNVVDWDNDDDKGYWPDLNTLNLGVSYEGIVNLDLNKNAHAFIAGETGSGKSVLMKGMIYQALWQYHDVVLIDFKRGVSFSAFEKFITIYSDYGEIKEILESLVKETNSRYDMFRKYHVEDINQFNNLKTVPYRYKRIIVFIDELAELVSTSDRETTKSITNSLESLTRISRAAGINLIMGLQRPDSSIVSGQIKNNVTYRVAGRFVDPEPSRIMLGNDLASHLPPVRGRFIVRANGFTEFQGFRFTEDLLDIDGLTEWLREANELQEPPEREPHQQAPSMPEATEPEPTPEAMFNFDNIEI